MLTIELFNDSKLSNTLLHHLINESIQEVPDNIVKVQDNGRIKIIIGGENLQLDVNILANIASIDEE